MAFGEAAARDPQCRPEKLARLARSGNRVIRELVALNPSAPGESLAVLAGDGDSSVVLAVADNLSTPPAALDELSRSSSAAVREAVARNPRTLTSTLADLVEARGTSDREKLKVAANPSASAATLSILRMSRTFTSSDTESQMLIAVAGNPSAAEDTLRHLFRREEKSFAQRAINHALASNPAVPLDTRVALYEIDAYREAVVSSEPFRASPWRVSGARSASSREAGLLAQSPDPEVRRSVALAPGATDMILRTLAADTVPTVARVALARITVDRSQFLELVASNDIAVLESLIRNPGLPADLRAVAARAGLSSVGEDTLELIAKNPTTSADILSEVLSKASGAKQGAAAGLKQAVAQNASVSAETLLLLAADDSSAVRRQVAKASATPLEGFVKLAGDTDPAVREVVAKNSATPAELLLRLATDDAPAVVEAVAAHPNTTPNILDRIVNDQLERRRQLHPKSQVNRDLPKFPLGPLVTVAGNPKATEASLQVLAESACQAVTGAPSYPRNETMINEEARVLTAIASHPAASVEVLDMVARVVHKEVWTKTDPHQSWRALEATREATLIKIVGNPSASMETLEFLSSGDWVARRTTRRIEREYGYRTTTTIWDYPATAAAVQDMASSVREEISRRQWSHGSAGSSRLGFASNPDASPDILAELSGDSDPAVRRAVAGNPSTSPEVFARLASDPTTEVRIAAAAAKHPDQASSVHSSHHYVRVARELRYGAAFGELAKDVDPVVRTTVAENLDVFWRALPQDLRDRLVFDGEPRIRSAILGAISVRVHRSGDDFGFSQDAIFHLIETSDAEVWRTLAEKGSMQLPVAALNRLADTGDTETVVRVVNAYKVELALLTRLAASEDVEVLDAIASRLSFRDDDWSMDEGLVEVLLKNLLTPDSFLEKVTSQKYLEARIDRALTENRSRAERSSTSSWSAESFLERVDEELAIRERVELDDRFLHLALTHPNFPEATLIEYAAGSDERLIIAATRAGNARVKSAAASNLATPAAALALLAGEADPEVREALILNSSTPPEVLVRLIQDGGQQR